MPRKEVKRREMARGKILSNSGEPFVAGTCVEVPESPADAISRVCRERSITLDAFKASRALWCVDARREVARALHSRGMPMVTIGHFLGCRDRTTVSHLLASKRLGRRK